MLSTERSKKSSFFKKFASNNKFYIISAVLILFAVYLAGCVNYEQKTALNKDGSGTMTVHYWTKMSNLKSGKDVGNFSFDESKAKSNYSSSNNEVTSIKIKDNLEDSTTHVEMDIKFKNINEINSAKGFEKVKASWKEGKEGMDFSYIVAKDTSAAKNMGANENVLNYEFTFPDEILSTNGIKDGKKVKWNRNLSDLKEDLEMTATVKSEGKKCGLFGMEFPLIALAGLALIRFSSKRKK